MAKRLCLYSAKWEANPLYKDWLKPVKGAPRRAMCKVCDKSFDIGNGMERGIKSHGQSSKHLLMMESRKPKTNLSAFGFTSVKKEKDTDEDPPATQQLEIPLPPPVPSDGTIRRGGTPSASQFVSKEGALRAEVRWVLKLVYNHYSYKSSEDTKEVFADMFPDSQIVHQFACGEKKAAYMSVFGLAEHFKHMLMDSVKGPFVILFDESLNHKLQEKQMDIHIRFWDEQLNQVKTRYLTSEFMGHATAAIVMEHFVKSVFESDLFKKDLNIHDMIQLSMDGPNVNWKFFGDLQDQMKEDHKVGLLNLGSCGLHIVHNSFRTGMSATGWDVPAFLSAIYNLLKDAPARREDFINTTSIGILPLKFTSHRWLENVSVCERAILLYDSIKTYVHAANMKEVTTPKCQSFQTVKRCSEDKLFVAKMHFFKSTASLLQPFEKKFQTDRPMVPFLSDDLCSLVKVLMRKFIDPKHLRVTNDKLVQIDVTNTLLHVDSDDIDIGFAAQKLRECGAGQRQVLEFRMEAKACLVAIVKLLLNKCPASYQLVRNLSCFNPVKMATKRSGSVAKF